MKYSILAVLMALIVSACSSSGDDIKDYREENDAEIAAYIANNNLNATKSVTGLYYVIEEEGTGKAITATSDVTVSFNGYFTNGVAFASTGDNLASFYLHGVIAGFAEGLMNLNEGGKATFLIPSHLGYGSNDSNGIPGGSVLIYEVDVFTPEMIAEKNDEDIIAYLEAEGLDAIKTESGLYYIIEEEGTGAQPTSESNVTIAYAGYFLNGIKFEESNAAGTSFYLNAVIDGWKEGITYFKEGGSGKLIIPAHLGYGSYNHNNVIPGGSVLVFDIDLMTVNQ